MTTQTRKKIFLIVMSIALFATTPALAQTFDWFFKKGYEAHQKGNLAEAEKYYLQALDLNGNSAALHNQLGKLYQAKGAKLADIVWYYKGAIDIDPNSVEAYENLGRLYQQKNMYDPAIKNYEKVLEFNPNQLSTLYAMGWLYLMGKDEPHRAVHYFESVLEKTDSIPMAYFGLGLAHSKIGNTPQVLDVVTTLKARGETDLARKLESAIRKPWAPKREEYEQYQQDIYESRSQQPRPDSTVVADRVGPPQPVAQPGGNVQLQGSPGETRIRLRGSLFGPDPRNPPREYREYGTNP